MNPGISALVRLTMQLTKENARRAWRATADILTYFLAIPNNLGDVILPPTTNAVGFVEEVFAVAERLLGILVNGDRDGLDVLVAVAFPCR
jgi:hypothetical protein